jgi:mannose-6-phosphate isomerase-like protein (cupin superfamily)
MTHSNSAVDLNAVLAAIDEPWQPRTVAVFNDYDLRVVKLDGEFSRHSHPETDEVFLLLKGTLTIRHDDHDVHLLPGQAYVVPRGVYHFPIAAAGTEALLIEPSATVNTGDTPSEFTTTRQLAD